MVDFFAVFFHFPPESVDFFTEFIVLDKSN
jgi:hypothetical protein